LEILSSMNGNLSFTCTKYTQILELK